MWSIIQQYFWVFGLVYLVWIAPDFERRAYALAAAGRLSPADASRVTRFAWLSVLAIVTSIVTAQFTYDGPRGHCPMFADPLRPATAAMWLVVGGVLLTIVGCTLTAAGRAFLIRVWPAVAITEPLGRVWQPREVVKSALSNTLVVVLYFGAILGVAIARPGSFQGC